MSLTKDDYKELYQKSLKNPEGFWQDMAERIDWFKEPTKVCNSDVPSPDVRWFEDGVLNACYNCVDRHLPQKADDIALIFEADEPGNYQHITYGELKEQVCKVANALKELGVQKGDRVIIYMPMVCEAVYAMLACARIGAVHSVVFGGFSPDSLANRIEDCGAKVVITADEGLRGGRRVPLKVNTDKALERCDVESVLVFQHTHGEVSYKDGRDYKWSELVNRQDSDCPCEEMGAEDPLFILYTSGSTGKPKGIVHTTGGYMVYASLTHEVVFDYQQGDVYWCTADVGWITGHSYIVYGPLANGATNVIFEGVPSYPDVSRFWQVVDTHKVNAFYTAPTAIRALLKEGDDYVTKTSRESLKILGSVGEPINKEAWQWYYDVVGEGRCPIVDTWWQTETGGIMITPLSCHDLKPGAASKPFFGVKPEIVSKDGEVLEGEAQGLLCIGQSWPSQARTIYGDHERFIATYFAPVSGKYFTGDGARRDADGDIWITGRVDDVINVSGHRFGTAEIEDAIDQHEDVAESAVVGYPHDIKGQGIYAYVTLRGDASKDEAVKKEIIQTVREIIGPIASPDIIHFADGLPKTRSGKIMRRILRKIAENNFDDLGDISTLADPNVVDDLIRYRKSL